MPLATRPVASEASSGRTERSARRARRVSLIVSSLNHHSWKNIRWKRAFGLIDVLLISVGGTFSSKADGAVGSQFEKDGAVGGVSLLIPYLPFLNPLTDHPVTSCDRPLPTCRPPRRPATRSGTPARPSRARSKHALLETSTFSIYGGELDCIPLR